MIWTLMALGWAQEQPRLVLRNGQALPEPQAGWVRTKTKNPADGQGSRRAVRYGAQEFWSPLVWVNGSCDGDEVAVGHRQEGCSSDDETKPGDPPTATLCPPAQKKGSQWKWCPDATRLPTLELQLQLQLVEQNGTYSIAQPELSAALDHLSPLREVWEHGHYDQPSGGRPLLLARPGEQTTAIDSAGFGRAKEHDVVIGWLQTEGRTCRLAYGDRGYRVLDNCTFAPESQPASSAAVTLDGEMLLFPFAESYDEAWGDPAIPLGARVQFTARAIPGGDRSHDEVASKPQDGSLDGDGSDGSANGESSIVTWIKEHWGALVCFGVAFLGLIAVGVAIRYMLIKAGKGIAYLAERVTDLASTLWQRLTGSPPETAPAERARTPKATAPVQAGQSFEDAVAELHRASWAELHPHQAGTLAELARGQGRTQLGNYDGRLPLRSPFEGTPHQATWAERIATLETIDLTQPTDEQQALVAAAVSAFLAREAEAFASTEQGPNSRPSTYKVLVAFLAQYAGFGDNLRRVTGTAFPDPMDYPHRRLAALVHSAAPAATAETPPESPPKPELPPRPQPQLTPNADSKELARTKAQLQAATKGLADANAALEECKRRLQRTSDELTTERDAHRRTKRDLTEKAQTVATLRQQLQTATSRAQETEAARAKLARKVEGLSASQAATAARLSKLAQEQAEQKRREEEERLARENKLHRPDARFLVECFEQAYAYGALREALRHIVDVGDNPEHGGLLQASAALLDTSSRVRAKARERGLAGQTDYLEAWNGLDEDLRQGAIQLQAFVAGAREIDNHSDAEKLVEVLLETEPYLPKGTGMDEETWGPGFQAWKALYRVATRQQGDDGAALGTSVKRQIFEGVLVPWLRLAQFMEEALPVEVSGPIGNMGGQLELQLARNARKPFERLGYTYEHVPLYQANKRDYITRRNQVAVSPVKGGEVWFTLPPPRGATHQTVVRVQQPLITQSPAGHIVRAQIWCLEED